MSESYNRNVIMSEMIRTGTTKQHLAEFLGLNPHQVYYRLSSGTWSPVELCMLADYFHRSVDYLLTGENNKEK